MFTSPFPAITLHIAGGAFWSTLSLRPSYEMCSTDKLDLEIPFFCLWFVRDRNTTPQNNKMKCTWPVSVLVCYWLSVGYFLLVLVVIGFQWTLPVLSISQVWILYKRACGAEKKPSMQHAERTLPWINRGSEMCEKGHPHLRGEQRSVPFIFSVLWRSWMNAHRSGLKVNLV